MHANSLEHVPGKGYLLSIRNFGQKSYYELIDRLKLRKLVPDDAPVLAAAEAFEEE